MFKQKATRPNFNGFKSEMLQKNVLHTEMSQVQLHNLGIVLSIAKNNYCSA
jgi:hypothetical protein